MAEKMNWPGPSFESLTANPLGRGGPEAPSANQHCAGDNEITLALKKNLEETRLPANLKEQILAELPSFEEQERLYRELQEKGGLTSEQFLGSLGIEADPLP
jgi:hypothetical protein